MAKKLDSKKVWLGKLVVILVTAVLLGISLLFSPTIEGWLGIGARKTGFTSEANFLENELRVHYIDVGQGDSTLICLPDGTTMLVDAGTPDGASHLINYIKSLNISTIDYFVVTHSDNDHIGGASKVLENFEVKNIYRPFQIAVTSQKVAIESEELAQYAQTYKSNISLISTQVYQKFITAVYSETYSAGSSQVLSNVIVHHDGLVIGSQRSGVAFQIEFFAPLKIAGAAAISVEGGRTTGYPTKYYKTNSANNSSPVMVVEYKDQSFMFTGDADQNAEADFLESLTPTEKQRLAGIDVFQAGHHGSATSNCQEFLELIQPTYVVVSCGKDNSYGHPTPEFLQRVSNLPHNGVSDYLVRTDTMGDITFGYTSQGFAYTANKAGDGVSIFWWEIALGIFIVVAVVTLSVKVTSNKAATAKRIKSKAQKVVKEVGKK